jgi:hypothetical protein
MTRGPQDAFGRAQWLLDFAQSKFEDMNEDERNQWGIELGKFNGGISHDSTRRDLQTDTTNTYAVWDVLTNKLESLRRGEAWREPVQARLKIRREGGAIKVGTQLRSDSRKELKHAALLFEKLGGSLAICANDRCNNSHPRFFIKKKRQAYCTTRCRETVNKRKYRRKQNPQRKPTLNS